MASSPPQFDRMLSQILVELGEFPVMRVPVGSDPEGDVRVVGPAGADFRLEVKGYKRITPATFVNCREFLNADLIAAGLAPFAPETQAVRASELLLKRIDELVATRTTFSFETTLAARSYQASIIKWRRLGYRVVLYFIWLFSAEMAIERVVGRVQQGGHHIPEPVVRRRYARGLRNLFELYMPIVSNVYVFDGTAFPPILVAEIEGENTRILDYARWELIVRQRMDASHD